MQGPPGPRTAMVSAVLHEHIAMPSLLSLEMLSPKADTWRLLPRCTYRYSVDAPVAGSWRC
jgi:hypothetical protein